MHCFGGGHFGGGHFVWLSAGKRDSGGLAT